MMRLLARAWAWLFGVDPGPAEMITASAALAWGLWVLNPWVDSFRATPTFSFMDRLAPESAWGLSMACVGIAGIAAVVHGGLRPRKLASLLLAAAWAFWGMAAMRGVPESTAGSQYGVLALSAGWAYLRLGIELHAQQRRKASWDACGIERA